MDERNAVLADQSRKRRLRDVLAESEQVFAQLLAVIAACPDALLNDPRRLGLPDDVMPWALVANNSYAHYREHAGAIRAWLEAQAASTDAPSSDSKDNCRSETRMRRLNRRIAARFRSAPCRALSR